VHRIVPVVLRTTGAIFVTRRCFRPEKIRRTVVIVPRERRNFYLKVVVGARWRQQYRVLALPLVSVGLKYRQFAGQLHQGKTPRRLGRSVYEESA